MYSLDNTTRLGGYPSKLEQVETKSGPLTKFRLPTNRKVGGEQRTEWHDCVAFGKTGELIARLWRPKTRIDLEGRIEDGHYMKTVGAGDESVEVRIPTVQIIVNSFNFTFPSTEETS